MYLLIDIGGSSIKSGVWIDGEIVEKQQVASPDTWEMMLDILIEIKEKMMKRYRLKAVSFSVPGVANEISGEIEGASSLHYLHGFSFVETVENAMRIPVFFENDANCAALAESVYGAAADAGEAILVVIGTGIGGTIIANKQIIKGHHLYGGEFGMMLINGHDEWSILGSPVHMARKVAKKKGLPINSVGGKEVFAWADEKDQIAIQAVENLYHYLALGIYNLQYILDPEIIVLGGGISEKKDLVANIERHLKIIMTYGQRAPLFPKIRTCQFGNDSNLIGAAINCNQKMSY